MNLRFGTSAALAVALISAYGLAPARRRPTQNPVWIGRSSAASARRASPKALHCPPPGTWPRARASPGRRRSPASACPAPSSGAISPASAPRSAVRRTPASRSGLYGDVRPVARRHRARVARLLPRQEDRRRPLAADRAQGRPQNQAAHQSLARQFDARHRRRTPDRFLRIGGALRLRPQGQAAVEEGPRRPRCRLVHRSVGAMGNRQLAHPPRQRRRHPGGRAEGLVPRRVRRARRPRAVARRAGATCRRGARPPCIR